MTETNPIPCAAPHKHECRVEEDHAVCICAICGEYYDNPELNVTTADREAASELVRDMERVFNGHSLPHSTIYVLIAKHMAAERERAHECEIAMLQSHENWVKTARRLEEALRELMAAITPALTGIQKNVPKSSWAKQWDEAERVLAESRAAMEGK
jgi:hypothetical protein